MKCHLFILAAAVAASVPLLSFKAQVLLLSSSTSLQKWLASIYLGFCSIQRTCFD